MIERFDDVVTDEYSTWSQVCTNHAGEMTAIVSNKGGAIGICGVIDCKNEAEFYVDFKPTMKREGIKVEGHRGTWYVIVETAYKGVPLFLLEHETYGEDADHIVINAEGTLIMEEVVGGVAEVLERMADNDESTETTMIFFDKQSSDYYSAFTTVEGLGQNLLEDALSSCEDDAQAAELSEEYKDASVSKWLELIREYGYKPLVADEHNIEAWEGCNGRKFPG